MGNYDDIINLPAPVSDRHPHMSMVNRGAQFAPFAALSGYEEAVDETARLTARKIESDDEEIRKINRCLVIIREKLREKPEIKIDYFVFDEYKEGGRYESVTGTVRKIDEYAMILYLDDGTAVPIDDILEISGRIFEQP
ncbi:MAG: hypothetical protein II702_00475 [Clostridia bacterium]|jgi:hypothetical protein|nr:hypothetical protein [Clostridia bacterium]MBQ4243362.1 hypothetical protein [Clostridia bacterium]